MQEDKIHTLVDNLKSLQAECIPIFPGFGIVNIGKMNQIICEMSEALSDKVSDSVKKDEILREARRKADSIIN